MISFASRSSDSNSCIHFLRAWWYMFRWFLKFHNEEENTQPSGFWQWWLIQDILLCDFQVADKPHFVGLPGVCLSGLNSSSLGSIQDGKHFLLAILGLSGEAKLVCFFFFPLVRYTLVNFSSFLMILTTETSRWGHGRRRPANFAAPSTSAQPAHLRAPAWMRIVLCKFPLSVWDCLYVSPSWE